MRQYIEECLKSVLAQTFHDIEIIVVDAGSTDGTLDLIGSYAVKDKRLKIIHSGEKSYGYQMNMGISEAKGDYIAIVETDDYVEPDMLEALYDKLDGTDAEYCKGMAEEFMHIGTGSYPLHMIYPNHKLNDMECVESSPLNEPDLFLDDKFLWNGLYRMDFLSRIKFNETPGAAFQDIGVLFRIMHEAKHAFFINKLCYHYRQDNMLASSYNTRSLDFVRYEYESLLPIAMNASDRWKHIFFIKMVLHTVNRFWVMAEGDFWEESHDACKWLRDQIGNALAINIIKIDDFDSTVQQEIQLFLKDDYALYQSWHKTYGKPMPINELLDLANFLQKRNVVIFGCGSRGFWTLLLALSLRLPVVGFCDNDVVKQGHRIYGLQVMSLEDAIRDIGNPYFIVANKKHGEQIAEQLRAAGVKEDNMFVESYEQIPFKAMIRKILESTA